MKQDKSKTKEQLISELAELRKNQQEIEEALRESDERYRGVIDNIGVGISLISPGMEILFLNNQMKNWFPDVDASKKPACYRAFNNPPKDTVCSYCPTFKTLQDGRIYEAVTDTPAGVITLHYKIVSSPLRDKDGNIMAAIEMVYNITEQTKIDILLKKERKTFFSILQKAPYGVVMIDKDGRYLYINDEFVNITGYTLEDIPTGRAWFRKVYPDTNYRKHVIAAWKGDIAKKGVQIFTILCRNGKKKEVQFKSYSLDEDSYIVMLSDITKQRRAERAIKRAHEELENKVRERTVDLENLNKELEKHIKEIETINNELKTFNYSVSHDLKTPVIAIEGLSQRLLDKYNNILDTTRKQYLMAIHKSTVSMREFIDDLLAFFSLGRKNIELYPVNIEEIIREVFEQLKMLYAEHIIELHLEPLPKTYADAIMIRQVVSNLLSNAVKYSKHREIIRVEAGGWAETEKNIYYIKDNGIGFPMEYADKIFEVLERLHSTDEFEGTGIGLAIVKRVINRHGGEVWAESKVNNGAKFYFELPRIRKETYTNK